MITANNNRENHEFHVRVAWYYYKAGMTQAEIATRLGINRARVAKILDKARREGIISIQVNSPYTNCLKLEKELTRQWKLRDALITPEVDRSVITKT